MSGWTAVLAVLALLTLCGLGVLAALGVARSPGELLRRAGLAPLAGIAWAGVIGATLATAGSRLGIAGLIGLAVVTCAAGTARLAFGDTSAEVASRFHANRLELTIAIAALSSIAVVCVFALAAIRDKPLAEYDGWAMWGMKARALASLGSADPAVFASDAYERLHLEYPLLLPALHSLPLQAASSYTSNTVVLSCLAIGFAGLLAIWSLLHDRVRPAVLLAFVAAIATMPAFFGQLKTGYADVPLAVFVAVGVVAAARWLRDGGGGWLALATLFFAASVLTKNEGLLFVTSAYVPLLVVSGGRRRAAALSALIVALAYAPWRAYAAVHDLGAPDYDLSSSFDLPWVAGRLDRAPTATAELLELAVEPGRFGLLLLVGLGAAALAVLVGSRPLGILAGGFGILSAAGLTWIYVLTPYDLSFYLSTNGERVVVSPVLVLAALAPLLVEESARRLEPQAAGSEIVGTPR